MISVIVPARDAEGELRRTLAALPGVEVVVVANGCSDGTASVARAAGAKVVELERANRAAARNRGAEAASGERLLFTDAGVTPDPGWVDAMGSCLDTSALAGGPVTVTAQDPPSAAERFDLAWRFKQEHSVRVGGWTAGANLGITRSALELVGGFAEELRAGDDVDLCLRARAAGLEIGWCGRAVVSHPASRSIREVLRRGFRQGRSATVLHRRHAGRIGHRYWRHPGGIVRGNAALAALGVDVELLEPAGARSLRAIARAEYAARYGGSFAALCCARASGPPPQAESQEAPEGG